MSKKPNHTPGPWVFTSGANRKEKNIVAIDAGGPENGHPSIAKTICEDFGDNCNPDTANAHLIAAAPDLYREVSETVEAIRDCFKALDANDPDSVEAILTETISDLKAVLSKARGES